jgi:hypothetical protein
MYTTHPSLSTPPQVDILIGVDLNSQPMDPAYALIVSGEANSVDTVRGELNECSHQVGVVGVAYTLYAHTYSMRIHALCAYTLYAHTRSIRIHALYAYMLYAHTLY